MLRRLFLEPPHINWRVRTHAPDLSTLQVHAGMRVCFQWSSSGVHLCYKQTWCLGPYDTKSQAVQHEPDLR